MRYLLSFLTLGFGLFATTTYAQPAQHTNSIRWTVIVRDAQRTQHGGFALWGSQDALRVEISVGNASGPRASSLTALTAGVAITMRHDGADFPVTWELADPGSNTLDLAEGQGRAIIFLVKPEIRANFDTGTYEFTVSLKKLLASLVLFDNTPWVGIAKTESSHSILLRPVVTVADRAAYDAQEANTRLGLGRPAEAVPFLEDWTRLRPDNWYAFATLGHAHLLLGHLPQAIDAYERSMPGWCGVRSQSTDQIATDVARAYVRANRVTEAAKLLRRHGLSDQEITTRMQAFQPR